MQLLCANRYRSGFKYLSQTVVACIAAFLSMASFADSSVWVASSETSKVYFAGTVHLLRPADYPLPEEFYEAYNDSSKLYFETDIASMNDLAVQASMLQQLMYSDSQSLQTVLSDEAYAALADYVSTTGLPMMMLDKFKPGLLVSTLQVIELQKLGFTPQGVDMHFYNRAIGDGKPTGELEPVQAQIDFIESMGEGNESEFILLSINEMEEIAASIDQLVAAWRVGNNSQLEEMFVKDMKEQSLDLYNSLLVERNNNWMPIIEEMFTEGGNELVLVGAAHLVGEDGLLHLLEAKGYKIQQL